MKSKFGLYWLNSIRENIGACARSLKILALKLNIVSPKFIFPNQKAKVTSVGV